MPRSRPGACRALCGERGGSKALGVGIRLLSREGIGLREVEVIPDCRGKPHVYLNGRAAELAAELGLREWAISLSHERDTAVAFVVAQG